MTDPVDRASSPDDERPVFDDDDDIDDVAELAIEENRFEADPADVADQHRPVPLDDED